jgi:hypothetical protein
MTETRAPNHSRLVVTALVAWIAIHVVALLAFGLPGYVDCRSQPATSGLFAGCGVSVGVIALAIGWIQLLYGGVVALVLFANKRLAIGQGVLIGMAAVTLLFTVLCFGAASTG